MSLANKITTINDLCDNLLCQIFDRLSVKKVIGIQRVNKDFYRSAKTWFKTVDKMTIGKRYILLSKSRGKRFDWLQDPFNTGKLFTFSAANRLLNYCTGIQNVKISASSAIDGRQLVHLVSRCLDIKQISINFYKLRFGDEDWTRLVELIKDCDIQLTLFDATKTNKYYDVKLLLRDAYNTVDQLNQLFTVAKKIKSVCFNKFFFDSVATLDHLNESTTVTLDNCRFSYHLFDEETRQLVSDVISKKVDTMKVNSYMFKDVPVRRFLKLSQLDILGHHKNPLVLRNGYQFPRLKRLSFVDIKCYAISAFFVAVNFLDQLNYLHLKSKVFLMDDQMLTVMLGKAPNISEVKISNHDDENGDHRLEFEFEPATVRVLVRMFEMMANAWFRLGTVDLSVSVKRMNVNEFNRLCDALADFAGRRKNVEVKVNFYGNKNYDVLFECLCSRKSRWPSNVRVQWYHPRGCE